MKINYYDVGCFKHHFFSQVMIRLTSEKERFRLSLGCQAASLVSSRSHDFCVLMLRVFRWAGHRRRLVTKCGMICD